MTPAERRAVVTQAQARFGLRCGTACRHLGVHRALVRSVSRRHEPPGLLARVRVPSPTPTRPDERWSMDFVRDTTTDGRPFRLWTLVDDCTRECPLVLVDRSLPSRRVIEGLEALLLARAQPATIV